jgi:hypothetical protein
MFDDNIRNDEFAIAEVLRVTGNLAEMTKLVVAQSRNQAGLAQRRGYRGVLSSHRKFHESDCAEAKLSRSR